MGKCTICNSRKGKRKCKIKEKLICSLCCGETRSIDKCTGCSFYKDNSLIKNYKKVPHISLSMMENNFDLQRDANTIESAICQFDSEENETLTDNIILKIIELLIDKYHFKEETLIFDNEIKENGFNLIDNAIKDDLASLTYEDISKILATIYRSILRHNATKRDYIEFIQQHVGIRIGKGARVMPI